MSSISAFRRCPKSFDLGYIRGLQPLKTNDAVIAGSSFHKCMEMLAKGKAIPEDAGYMGEIARAFVARHPLPRNIIAAEDPIVIKVGRHRIRFTPDLVYRADDGQIVVRDYKTFDRAPSLELDLDFQARAYIVACEVHYRERVRFEWVYVRRELFHMSKGMPDFTKPWSSDESYQFYPLSITSREAADMWDDLTETLGDISRKVQRERKGHKPWTRTDLKGNVNSCKGCFYSDLCRTEFAHGELTESVIATMCEPERRVI